FAVLLARIRAQLRQHEASEDAVFTIGPYTFRPSSKILLNPKGNKVRLTEKETAILRYLYRAGQRPVSRETLLQEVWGYNSAVTTHPGETHIYGLRQKVEKDAASPAILVTEAGGYKLVPYRRPPWPSTTTLPFSNACRRSVSWDGRRCAFWRSARRPATSMAGGGCSTPATRARAGSWSRPADSSCHRRGAARTSRSVRARFLERSRCSPRPSVRRPPRRSSPRPCSSFRGRFS